MSASLIPLLPSDIEKMFMSNMNERHHAGYIRRSHRDGELLSQFRKTEQLPADRKKLVKEVLDAFIF